MKTVLVSYFMLLTGVFTLAQENEIWTSFYDEKTDLIGFKNSKNEVKIEPKFMGYNHSKKV